MNSYQDWDEQWLDQAIAAFTEAGEAGGLDHVRDQVDKQELEALEQTIAAIHWTHVSPGQVPEGLMRKLQDQGQAWLQESQVDLSPGPGAIHDFEAARRGQSDALQTDRQAPKGRFPWLAMAGWAAAAVLLVMGPLSKPEGPPPVDQRMQDLVASADDLVRLDWAQGEDPLAEGVEGEVLWSSAEQEGFMVFRGLAANDPSQNQYQLWVFDTARPDWEAQPVDGGVFDVGPGGEVIVPIDPKLSIDKPGLFAITLERPGGVVVSKRERLLLLAQPAS